MNRRKEVIKIRVEINEIEHRENKKEAGFLKRLTKLTKRLRKKDWRFKLLKSETKEGTLLVALQKLLKKDYKRILWKTTCQCIR